MRVLVFSRAGTKRVEAIFKKHGHNIVKRNPDVVACWGGDGTLLLAEHKWPGIPKLALGLSKTCRKCVYADPHFAIKQFSEQKKLRMRNAEKFQAILVKGKRKIKLPLAMNDVVLRNKEQMHAIRFSVNVGKKSIATEQIGDGVVISTPFGSTAYYQSITRKRFSKGIGVAFNNTMEHQAAKVLPEKSVIEVVCERGDGTITVDTLEETWTMKTGDKLIVKKVRQQAKIIVL